jgi:bacillithiol system protein YtxJ
MNWIALQSIAQLEEILSRQSPSLLFKHSTRCSISSVALERLNKSSLSDRVNAYLLDLLSYRSISDAIATRLQVHHESPQVLLVKNGECCYDESHLSITAADLEEELAKIL